jgi:hypothetical protein
MKSKSTYCAAVLAVVGFVVIGYSEICRADWIPFDKNEDADFYYDKEDLKRSSSGIVTLWVKQIYTKKGGRDAGTLLGKNFENLDHSVTLFEVDCVGKMDVFLSTVYFSKNGTVLEIKEPASRWEFISAGSTFDILYSKVCQ